MRGIPFVEQRGQWSIGIYVGEDPFALAPPQEISNPVLKAENVTDVPAEFVADPFMIRENSTWYMFFEVMNANTGQGDIGLATSSDGLRWTYERIVLDEPFHLSYPQVFKWQDQIYMVPESHEAYSVRLYRALDFPREWAFVGILLEGRYVDPSLFHYGDKWWLFAETNPIRGKNDTLRLYYSDSLTGTWAEHPESPIIMGDANIARPGGRVILFDGQVVRYAQDDAPTYGNQVRAFVLDVLTTTEYREHQDAENPVLRNSSSGWNADGMHHIDPHRLDDNNWIAVVDGLQNVRVIGFGQ